jgi:hypothetical protein
MINWPRSSARLNSSDRPASHHEADQEQHEENVEQNLRDSGRSSGDSAEAEDAGDYRDNQKD